MKKLIIMTAFVLFIMTQFITCTFAAGIGKAVVTGNSVNIRTGASTTSKILGMVNKSKQFDVYSVSDYWVEIRYNDKVAYIYKKYVDIRTDISSRSGDSINRDAASGANILSYAERFLGIPYIYGGNTPSSGFDCSGYTKYVFAHFGYNLPRTAAEQATCGTYVKKADLQVGDMVFFGYYGSKGIDHVGIYAGNGQFIHSPHAGLSIQYNSLNASYYMSNYITARRIIK